MYRSPVPAPAPAIISDEGASQIFESVSNWGRWGPDDSAGTLNYLTDRRRKRGLNAAKAGAVVSCALPISTAPTYANRNPVLHVLQSGDLAPAEGQGVATDFLGITPHGPTF